MLKKVAVTGGLSCGKSSVCRFFNELGATVIRADDIVHRQLSPDTDLGKKVIELLGEEIVVKGKIDRSRIAKKVFNHPGLLNSLEQLLHPIVYEEIDKEYNRAKSEDHSPLFVAEVPLLFESDGEKYFDEVISVIANADICWTRFREETGYEREEYNRRMGRQLDPHKKSEQSDHIIENNGTVEELQIKVKNLFEDLKGK